jgi:hypothetical protein
MSEVKGKTVLELRLEKMAEEYAIKALGYHEWICGSSGRLIKEDFKAGYRAAVKDFELASSRQTSSNGRFK